MQQQYESKAFQGYSFPILSSFFITGFIRFTCYSLPKTEPNIRIETYPTVCTNPTVE